MNSSIKTHLKQISCAHKTVNRIVSDHTLTPIQNKGVLSASNTERILSSLPHNPYVSSNKTSTRIVSKQLSSRYPYIQLNQPTQDYWIVADIDEGSHPFLETSQFYQTNGLPQPNIVIKSIETGHYQLLFAIEPVCTSTKARIRPQAYLKRIKKALNIALMADDNFTGPLSWNPLFIRAEERFKVIEFHSNEYSLHQLADYPQIERHLDAQATTEAKPHLETFEVGHRNTEIFNHLRAWAYKNVGIYRGQYNYIKFRAILEKHAEQLNKNCSTPLPYSEISGISKSVGKFAFFKYQGRTRVMVFDKEKTCIERQSQAAQRTHRIRAEETKSKIKNTVERLSATNSKITQKALSEKLSLHRHTIAKYARYIKQVKERIEKIAFLAEKRALQKTKINVDYGVHQVTAPHGTSLWLRNLCLKVSFRWEVDWYRWSNLYKDST